MERVKKGIYIHIPFCVEKCYYCDFLSGKAGKEEQEKYIEALKNEILLTSENESSETNTNQIEIDTIFFGGGTPSILTAEQIAELLYLIKREFIVTEDAEITIECNPGTLTEEKCRVWRQAGFNRLSLGLQSAENHILKKIGRIHTYEQFLTSFHIARQAGFTNINIDVMSGLPGQSFQEYEGTLKKVVALEPEHISAYSLIVEEGTTLYRMIEKGKVTLPNEDTEMEMYRYTEEFLKKCGYHRYEISNYSLPRRECRHNLRYWELSDYFGFGVGAASLVNGKRYRNCEERKKYTSVLLDEKAERTPQEKILSEIRKEEEILTEKSWMEEFVFLGLRKTEGISAEKFEQFFGKSISDIYGGVIRKQIGLGMMEQKGDCFRLTSRGIDMSNEVLAEFLL